MECQDWRMRVRIPPVWAGSRGGRLPVAVPGGEAEHGEAGEVHGGGEHGEVGGDLRGAAHAGAAAAVPAAHRCAILRSTFGRVVV